ncbi:RagB/SusD family nutrient uptake outer membrane protein [Puteibacter caeruleilacunae]|nr:RagB/SusD family nutrient uptake outer membrane protein [Puteibacter caeruleilacunae]
MAFLTGCESSYLDVVPDNLATIEDAFSMRTNAEKYLFTCYSYMPRHGNVENDPATVGGDEMWGFINAIPSGATSPHFKHDIFNIALGQQNKINPIGNGNWDDMYKAIRDCNIFLENIASVPDMEELERREWASEVKFLKAYYHFYLVKLYGPVPVVDESLPIDADPEEVRVSRQPVDVCFDYIVSLLDEALVNLPEETIDPFSELGRITKPVAMALKAKVLLFHASPLFNGNNDFNALMNNDGTKLFNTTYDESRWTKAATACKEAIDLCESLGYQLFEFKNVIGKPLSDATLTQLSIRNTITDRWNEEIIWGNTQSWAGKIQQYVGAYVNEKNTENTTIKSELGAPIKIMDQFYSANGVPIEEDITWDYEGRYGTKKATEDDYPNIHTGYETTKYNFDREDRYYASIGFDGGVWYGQGKYEEDDLYYIRTKYKQPNNRNATSTFIKKLIHYENVQTPPKGYSVNSYPWPVIRLADLYLMYAEALNEASGPSAEAKLYIDKVRERAGLAGVDEAWSNFSSNPSKPQSQEGLREIIQQERLIELAFEAKRYYDIRRWKLAPQIMNSDVMTWDMSQESSELYSQPVVVYTQTFGLKDYFFPIKDSYIIRNRNLVQNLGW